MKSYLHPEAGDAAGAARLDTSLPESPDAANFGMKLAIVAFSILFAASLVGYFIIKSRFGQWPPPGAPPLPFGLYISTVILLAVSGLIHWAIKCVREGNQGMFAIALGITDVFAVGFLVSQFLVWMKLISLNIAAESGMFAFAFFFLTGLHALHVIGGLGYLGIVSLGALNERYAPGDCGPVQRCAMYWHFLDAAWIVLLIALVV